MASRPFPASQTKNVPVLPYPLTPSLQLNLTQQDANASFATTGSTLWLSGQVLAAYLLDVYGKGKGKSREDGGGNRGKRVIELGSGIGLTGLVLAHLGFSTLMSDVPYILSSFTLPNTRQNLSALHSASSRLHPPVVEARELDWTVPPSSWDWSRGGNGSSISSDWKDPYTRAQREKAAAEGTTPKKEAAPILPPFDLIVTTDTIYHPSLLPALLSTLKHLSLLSLSTTCSPPSATPPILLALERRDPSLIDSALVEARSWGFECKRIGGQRIGKSVERHLGWTREDWEGVEVWKLRYRGDKKGEGDELVEDS